MEGDHPLTDVNATVSNFSASPAQLSLNLHEQPPPIDYMLNEEHKVEAPQIMAPA